MNKRHANETRPNLNRVKKGSKRGRPSIQDAERRRDALLDQALRYFVQYGYKATSLDSLATSMGASKSTIYRQYGSKAQLLRAAMQRSAPSITAALDEVDADPRREIPDVLRDFALVVQGFHFDPTTRALWRAVSEAREELDHYRKDAAKQQAQALAPIARYLGAMSRQRRLVVDDAHADAASFAELAGGGLYGFLSDPPSMVQRKRMTARALRLFLLGASPR